MEEKNFISKATDEESGSNVSALDTNKTLFIDQYTTDVQSEDPELFEDAKTIGDVFDHFKPNVEVSFTDDEGGVVSETLHFHEIKDFEVIRKQTVQIPEKIEHIVKCFNPNCVTNKEHDIPTKFRVKYVDGKLRLVCHYCEKYTSEENIEFI